MGSGDLKMKVKDIIKEAFGRTYARDPDSGQIIKDPKTNRPKTVSDPNSFTTGLQDIMSKYSQDIGSYWHKLKPTQYTKAQAQEPTAEPAAASTAEPAAEPAEKKPQDIVVPKPRNIKARPTPVEPVEQPYELGSMEVPAGQRISVQNPQRSATFYKYPNGRWFNEFNQPMPSHTWDQLNQMANAEGAMEAIPKTKKRK